MMDAGLKPASLLPIMGLAWLDYWWKAGDVSITGDVRPPIVLMEHDAILSCRVGGCSPSSLEVWLYKWGCSKKDALYIYSGPKQDKVQESSTEERHENGTHRGQFKNGVLEVTLFRVQTADSGQYVCAMTCGRVHKEVTMDVIVTGIINAHVGEDVILPCYLKETHDLSHWKLQWRRIGRRRNQAIYSYRYQDTCPVLYSEDSLSNKCSDTNGPIIREWLGNKYKGKAEVSTDNRKSSLKLNNIKEEDAGRYQCSVRSNSFNKTIIFQLSTIEIHDQDMEVLKFDKCEYLTGLAFFLLIVLFCFAAHVDEQKQNYEEEIKTLRSKDGEQKQNYEEEIKSLRSQDDEQKQNYEKEIKTLRSQNEFLEAQFYRVDVTLDSSTAHPRLDVSEDGKSVRDAGDVLKVPNSKERFDSHMFVLAKESFVKGKRYWEVEVGQKKSWDLGVASESISRKGKITLAPQNGYWVIGLDGNKDYWARTDPWTRLEVSGKPTKIGMFLNIPERTLSFYDIDRRKQLKAELDHMFLRILDQCPEFVRVQVESIPLRIWPSIYAEHLKANIEFLEARFYRVDVTLDSSTAHPRLDVSEDGKSVRDAGDVLKVPNSEGRFDSHMFVLAKEGFVKGKRYWEVEVGQKKSWDLGVATESVSRKGKIMLAPQNGYWVIGRDGNKDYWARTDPWTRLEVSGKPTKIGMFLDMSAGHLSFYDVYRKSKLFTFTIKHSGKLYPFFSTGFLTESLDSHPLKVPPWLEEDEPEIIVSGINNFNSI
ncbi:hypothetical protein lerEdw1_010223 [Lerista edwardsae]|nr:hypothetical protein lerEdw1_010223 [Lerista edwardsae]